MLEEVKLRLMWKITATLKFAAYGMMSDPWINVNKTH